MWSVPLRPDHIAPPEISHLLGDQDFEIPLGLGSRGRSAIFRVIDMLGSQKTGPFKTGDFWLALPSWERCREL